MIIVIVIVIVIIIIIILSARIISSSSGSNECAWEDSDGDFGEGRMSSFSEGCGFVMELSKVDGVTRFCVISASEPMLL